MKNAILLLSMIICLFTFSTATIYNDDGSDPYLAWQTNDQGWYEGTLCYQGLNNNTIYIWAETLVHTGNASYVYVSVAGNTDTQVGNPASGDAWVSFYTDHGPGAGTVVYYIAEHSAYDSNYGQINCSTSMNRYILKP
jgi:hypothetical protein